MTDKFCSDCLCKAAGQGGKYEFTLVNTHSKHAIRLAEDSVIHCSDCLCKAAGQGGKYEFTLVNTHSQHAIRLTEDSVIHCSDCFCKAAGQGGKCEFTQVNVHFPTQPCSFTEVSRAVNLASFVY